MSGRSGLLTFLALASAVSVFDPASVNAMTEKELRGYFDVDKLESWSVDPAYKNDYSLSVVSDNVAPPKDPDMESDCDKVVYGFVNCRKCLPCEKVVAVYDSCGFVTGKECVPFPENIEEVEKRCANKSYDEFGDERCYSAQSKSLTAVDGSHTCTLTTCEKPKGARDCEEAGWSKLTPLDCAEEACEKFRGGADCSERHAKCYAVQPDDVKACGGVCDVWSCVKKDIKKVDHCYNYRIDEVATQFCRRVSRDECGNESCMPVQPLKNLCDDCIEENRVIKCKDECKRPVVHEIDGVNCALNVTCEIPDDICPKTECPQPGQGACYNKILRYEPVDNCGCRKVVCGPDRSPCQKGAICPEHMQAIKSVRNYACDCELDDDCVCRNGPGLLCCSGTGCCEEPGCCKDEKSCCPKDKISCGESCVWIDKNGTRHTVHGACERTMTDQCPAPYHDSIPNPLCCHGNGCCKTKGCCRTAESCCLKGCCWVYNMNEKMWLRQGDCAPSCDKNRTCMGDKCCASDGSGSRGKCCPKGECCCLLTDGSLRVDNCSMLTLSPQVTPVTPPVPPCDALSKIPSRGGMGECCTGSKCCIGGDCCPEGKSCCEKEGRIRVVGDKCCRGDGCCTGEDCCNGGGLCCDGCFSTCHVKERDGHWTPIDHMRTTTEVCGCREEEDMDEKKCKIYEQSFDSCVGKKETNCCGQKHRLRYQDSKQCRNCTRSLCTKQDCPVGTKISDYLRSWL